MKFFRKRHVSTIVPIANGFRARFRSGDLSAVKSANRAKFWGNDLQGALQILFEQCERNPNGKALEKIGEYYINMGVGAVARSVLRDVYFTYGEMAVCNLIYADVQAVNALVDDDKKLLYIAIPKCGSSSVKNYFTLAKFGREYGERVHFKHQDMYRFVTSEDLKTRYSDYYKFTVVRDPVKRAISYYTRNIVNGALKREALGLPEYMGLTTTPSPLQFAIRFSEYRQMFLDFRHHTNPISGYLAHVSDLLDDILQMDDLGKAREIISDRYSVSIPDKRVMATEKKSRIVQQCEEEFVRLKEHYKIDYEKFLRQ